MLDGSRRGCEALAAGATGDPSLTLDMKPLLTAALGAAAFLGADRAFAQYTIPLHPFGQTGDLFVADPTNDQIVRLQDLDLDGRYDSPGETHVFYSDLLGAVELTNPNGITVGINGMVYVTDSTEERVFRLIDLDGDGTCHGPGEATVYYDGTTGPVRLASPQNLCVDLIGNLYVSVAGDGADNQDRIVLLADTDFSQSIAPNEAKVLHDFPLGATGANIPQDVQIGPDLHLYFVENGTGVAKGVYRLDDANIDGVYTGAEVAPFFLPPAGSATSFFWGLTIDAQGFQYLADTGNERIWRFRDENGDHVIDPSTEATVWWQAPGASNIWRVAAASDGSVYAAESQAPDRILRLVDANQDGVVDPVTETIDVWSDLVAPVDIDNPRTLAFERWPTVLPLPGASVSAPFTVQTYATELDTVLLYWSLLPSAPVPLPPIGVLGIDMTPGISGFLAAGVVPSFGPFTVTVPALNQPGLVGATVYFQALVGKPARLRLSTVGSTTFTP